ncbi:erythromycin esterase family protein [Steroidobacter sp. S1-65]|uniref:Erythromycin esterase family protein n=1 Tax=Steroidobacter gossypii TaxID=2805490 RepID=A0ABS1X0Y3_9GAMM|nr:erythromycin esterase family protein [Steroidobacter gossypii]MBM0106914.1 erythromycin esterase family protein [Steroidobacter gossypii]
MPCRFGHQRGRARWASGLLAALLACSTGHAEQADELQRWIEKNAAPLRSIAATDEDFRDLEPLLTAIGPAEVVQLGEPGHGAGNSFAAKVRLIKFLHQRMGFDVLVWESGMHGMRLADAAMRGESDAVSAAQRGIFTIWSNAEEVRPLLEYVKSTQATSRPLQMAGFDLQFTARNALDAFSEDLRAFVSAIHEPTIRSQLQADVDRALATYHRLCCELREARRQHREHLVRLGTSEQVLAERLTAWDKREALALRPTQQDLDAFSSSSDAVLNAIQAHRALFEQAHGAKGTSFMEQALINLRVDAQGKLDIDHGVRGETSARFRNAVAYFNRRDERNAHNLRWLIEQGYPGRKLIVWAHNVHVTRAHFAPGFAAVHVHPRAGDMKPTGAYLSDWFGPKIYTIALTTYRGKDRWVTGDRVIEIPPSEAGSLEARLHALGKPYWFLDLRAAAIGSSHVAGQPLKMRMMTPVPGSNTAAPPHGSYLVEDIRRAFDGVFFIDETTPATPIRAQ